MNGAKPFIAALRTPRSPLAHALASRLAGAGRLARPARGTGGVPNKSDRIRMASPVHHGAVAMVTSDDQWSGEMQRMVVVIFDTEALAHKAFRALETLVDDNFIAVNADSVVTKDPDRTTRVVQSRRNGRNGCRRELTRSIRSCITCSSARADSSEMDANRNTFQQEERKS
jgi:hypothetical protein